MTTPAVVIPAENARHRLGRTLASVVAQTAPAAQILVVGHGSADGLADWLRLRWPAATLLELPADGGLDAVLAAVAAPTIAFLEPGARWPRDYLAAVATAWAEDRAGDVLVAPGDGDDDDPPALSRISARTAALADPHVRATADAIRRHAAKFDRRAVAAPPPGVRIARNAAGSAQPARDSDDRTAGLITAIAGLPASTDALVLDLQAASRPTAYAELLGMAIALGRSGRTVRAATLADLRWPALEAVCTTTPIVVTSTGPLDLDHATAMLLVQEILRRAGQRPVRVAAASLVPSSPSLLAGLLDAIAAHPDAELWLTDRVSRHYAASLLGPARVRLVPPPMLMLAPILRDVSERGLIEPAMLGIAPASDATDPALPWSGVDLAAGRRLAQGLGRVLGLWRWIKGPVLERSWLATIVGWAWLHGRSAPLYTDDTGLALLAALCGAHVVLVPASPKTRDFAATWPATLEALGIVPAPTPAGTSQ